LTWSARCQRLSGILPTQEPIVVLLTIKEENQFSPPLDARLKIAAAPRFKV
jgi:hypothetical protein